MTYEELVTAKRPQIYTNTAIVPVTDAFNPSAPIPAVSSQGASSDELITVVDMDYREDWPETRTNIGETRVYTHGAPDMGLALLFEADTGTQRFLRQRLRRDDTTLEIPVYTWLFRVTNAVGSIVDFRFRGKLTSLRVAKSRGEQGEFARLESFLRIIDQATAIDTTGSLMLESATVSDDLLTLILRFSAPVDPTTISASDVTFSPSNAFSTETEDFVVSGRTVRAKFASALTPGSAGTSYTVTVASTVADLQGNAIGAVNRQSFVARSG